MAGPKTETHPQRVWTTGDGSAHPDGEEAFTKWLAHADDRPADVPLGLGPREPYLMALEATLGVRLFDFTAEDSICSGDHKLDCTAVVSLGPGPDSSHRFGDVVIEAQFDRQSRQYWYQHLGQLLTYETVYPGRSTERHESDTSPPAAPRLAIWLVETDPNPSFRKVIARLNETLPTQFVLVKAVVDEREPTVRFDVLAPEPPIGTATASKHPLRHKFWTELTYRLQTMDTTHLTQPPSIPETTTRKLGSAIPGRGILLRFKLHPTQDTVRCIVKLDDRPDIVAQIEQDEQGAHRLRQAIGTHTTGRSFDRVALEFPPANVMPGDIASPQFVVERTDQDLELLDPDQRRELQQWLIECGDAIADRLPELADSQD